MVSVALAAIRPLHTRSAGHYRQTFATAGGFIAIGVLDAMTAPGGPAYCPLVYGYGDQRRYDTRLRFSRRPGGPGRPAAGTHHEAG